MDHPRKSISAGGHAQPDVPPRAAKPTGDAGMALSPAAGTVPSGATGAEPSRAASFVQLLQAVAVAANEASGIEQAARACLDIVCAFTGWPVGHLYVAEGPDELAPTSVWHLDDPEWFAAFRRVTEATRLRRGIGLPGRVLVQERPVWIPDVTVDPNFPRSKVAAELGIRAAFAFPVTVDEEIVAVLEFFATEPREPDELLLELLAHAGTQLGRVVERTRAAEALRRSELRFRSVADSASDAIISSDASGAICYWNRAARKIFGYAAEEVLGRQLEMLMPERYREAHRRGLARLSATGQSRLIGKTLELHGLRKDGTEFPLELSLAAWATEEGTFYSGIIRDVTERQTREHALATSEADREHLAALARQAQEANRVKDEFLATVSHELRTPLTAMLGWVRLLRSGKLDAETAKSALETVERNTVAQARLIGDLLDVSRIVTGQLRLEMGPVDLVPIIRAAVDVVRPAVEAKELVLELDLDQGAGPVWGDAQRLQQVLWNLLSNATKFTSRDGRIEVRLERAGAAAHIRVRDTGRGIAPEFLPYVFDRFRQAESTFTRTYGGMGLGLAIVRHLVELHGGTVEAESPGDGRGATFTVTLPLAGAGAPGRVHAVADPAQAGALPAEAEVQTPAESSALAGVRVLLVEDNADTLGLLATILERRGARVIAADSARAALAAFERERPDVLVADIGMPGDDGYELLRRVRELEAGRGRRIPAAAVTAYVDDADRERALSAGFDIHLAKPVEPEDLVRAVEGLAGRP